MQITWNRFESRFERVYIYATSRRGLQLGHLVITWPGKEWADFAQ
jgi:hypothetical protein